MRFAFCGDDTFLNVLQALAGEHEFLTLFRGPGRGEAGSAGVLRAAREAGANTVTEAVSRPDAEALRRAGCDVLVAASYPAKIPDLAGYVPYAMNVHPSILPRGRGPWPAPWFILKNLDRAGVTVHQLSPAWDQGDILAQASYDLDTGYDVHHISARSRRLAQDLVLDVVADPAQAFAARRPQEPGGDYWPSPTLADRSVEFSMPTELISRRLRAFGKYGVFAKWGGRPHLVRRAVTWSESHARPPGRVVLDSAGELLFATAEGYLLVQDADEIPRARRRP